MLSLPAILILALACTATVLPWGRGRLPILMYHKVRPGPADGLTVVLPRSDRGALIAALDEVSQEEKVA